jgi:hypothetical protein
MRLEKVSSKKARGKGKTRDGPTGKTSIFGIVLPAQNGTWKLVANSRRKYLATLEPYDAATRREKKMRERAETKARVRRTVLSARKVRLRAKEEEEGRSVLAICASSPSRMREKRDATSSTGLLNTESRRGGTKLLGTAPANSTWSHCPHPAHQFFIPRQRKRKEARAHLVEDPLRLETVNEGVSNGVEGEGLFDFGARGDEDMGEEAGD